MLYVYRQTASAGARELAESLEGQRYRGARIPIAQKVRRGDTVICWGERLDPIPGVTILNGTPLQNKYRDAIQLRERGIPTVEVRDTPPITEQPADTVRPVYDEVQHLVTEFLNTDYNRTSAVYRAGIRQLGEGITRLHTGLGTPLPPAAAIGVWLPRLFNHVGGNDLLTTPTRPEFWAKKENLRAEYRVHSFNQTSIRAGVKVPREGAQQHPWVRSWDGGWKISYDGVKSKNVHRELAHQAVTALGLQFGAVDIGEREDGLLIVLEVNRAPGLEGGTVEAYAKGIERWLETRE